MNGLTIAVPRGALFDGTLDALDRLGVDTAELRGNDRRLLFDVLSFRSIPGHGTALEVVLRT